MRAIKTGLSSDTREFTFVSFSAKTLTYSIGSPELIVATSCYVFP